MVMSPRSLRLPAWLVASCVLLAGLSVAPARAADDNFDRLLPFVPEGVNLLTTIRLPDVLDSPKGKFNKWRDNAALRFAQGLGSIPADARLVVMASRLDLARHAPRWEATILETSKLVTPERLAKIGRGYIDETIEVPAVWSPFNAYYVRLAPTRLGIFSPANRAKVLRLAKADQPAPLPKFLQQACDDTQAKGYAVMTALDLEDALDPELFAARISGSRALNGTAEADKKQLVGIAAGLQGVVLNIDFAEARPRAIVRLQFDRDPQPLAGVAAKLISELLVDRGASFDGFDEWPATAAGHNLTLAGELTDSQLRRLFMLTHLRLPEWTDLTEAAQEQESEADCSLRQYTIVQMLLNDLKLKEQEHPPVGEAAMWFGKYADRIESLSAENVDPELPKYRAEVAARLRRLQDVIQEPARPKVDPDVETEVKAIRKATKDIRKSLAEKFQREF